MSTEITKSAVKMSPRSLARVAGPFEAAEGITSSFGQVLVLGRLVVSNNAAITAANILAHQPLFWSGFALSLVGVACHVVWVTLFYGLFKPVNKTLSLLAAFVGLVVCAIQAVTACLYVAPLLILQSGSSVSGFSAGQLQQFALVFLKLMLMPLTSIWCSSDCGACWLATSFSGPRSCLAFWECY